MRLPAAGPSGLWIATDECDYVAYEQDTSRLHQDHIVLHEVGHMLCRHPAVPAIDCGLAGVLFPNLDPELVRSALGRHRYSSEEEQEAEIFASLLLERAEHGPVRSPVTRLDPATAAVLTRFEATIAPPRR